MTDGKVVQLVTRRDEVIESVAQTLEDLLVEACNGNVVALAVAYVEKDGGIVVKRSRSDGNTCKLIGAMSLAHHRLVKDWDEE